MPEFVDINGARTFLNKLRQEFNTVSGAAANLTDIQNLLDSKEWLYDSDTKVAEFAYVYRNNKAAPVKIQGVQSGDISISDTTITIADTAIDSDTAVTLSNGDYNYSLGADALIATTAENISVSVDGNATLTANDFVTFVKNSNATTIYGSSNNETISNSANSVLINCGAGDDYILNTADDVIINTSSGNNTICNSGNEVSISSGGNDFISLSGVEDNILSIGYGDDTIVGYSSSTGTIQADFNRSQIINDDVILWTHNGSVTIVDAKDSTLILNSAGQTQCVIPIYKSDPNLIVTQILSYYAFNYVDTTSRGMIDADNFERTPSTIEVSYDGDGVLSASYVVTSYVPYDDYNIYDIITDGNKLSEPTAQDQSRPIISISGKVISVTMDCNGMGAWDSIQGTITISVAESVLYNAAAIEVPFVISKYSVTT